MKTERRGEEEKRRRGEEEKRSEENDLNPPRYECKHFSCLHVERFAGACFPSFFAVSFVSPTSLFTFFKVLWRERFLDSRSPCISNYNNYLLKALREGSTLPLTQQTITFTFLPCLY